MLSKLAKHLRNRWGSSSKARRRTGSAAIRRRLRLEALEDRTLLSIDYADLAARLVGTPMNQGIFPAITQQIQSAFTNGDPVPFVGKQLANLFNPNNSHASTINPLLGPLDQIGNALATTDVSNGVQNGVVAALKPLDFVSGVTVSPDDPNASTITIRMNVTFNAVTVDSSLVPDFDMTALDGATHNFLTVDPGSTTNFPVNVGFKYHLQFTYQNDTSVTLDNSQLVQGANYPLLLEVTTGGTNLSFTGNLGGQLYAATSPGVSDNSQFTGYFGVDITNSGSTPLVQGIGLTTFNKIASDANLDIPLDIQFGNGSNSLPFNLQATQMHLNLDWTFDDTNGSLFRAQNDFGKVTSASFEKTQLQVAALGGFLNSAIEKIQQFATPFEPIAKILNAEVPGLSAIGINVSMAKALEVLGYPIDPILNFIDTASNLNNQLSGGAGEVVDYGNIVLAAPNNGTLLAALRAGNAVDDNHTPVLPPDVQGIIGAAEALNTSDGSVVIGFPLAEHSAPMAELLQGQGPTLFSLEAHLALPSVTVPLAIVPLGLVIITADLGMRLNLDLSLGYDTTGLKAAASEPAGTDAAKLSTDLISGFYFNVDQTGLTFTPSITVTGTGAFVVSVTGGLFGGLTLSPVGQPGTRRYIDADFQQKSAGDPFCALELKGDLYLQFSIDVGFDPPIGPHVTLWGFDSPKITLYDFQLECESFPTAQSSTLYVPLGAGDHSITFHEFKAPDPNEANAFFTGIQWEDDGPNGRNIGRVTTGHIDNSGIQSLGRVSTIVVAPELDPFSGQLVESGNDTVVIGSDVVGDTAGDAVDALMIGTDGGNDDFEYYGRGEAVLVGGKKNNTLVRGTLEFAAGLPPIVEQNVQQGNYSDFPDFITKDLKVDNQIFIDPIIPLLPGNPLINAPKLGTGDGADILVGTGDADNLYGGSGTNTFNGLGGGDNLYGNTADSNGLGASNNIFIESALRNDLDPARNPTFPDHSTDTVIGGNGSNLLEFRGYLGGEGTDNITVSTGFFFGPFLSVQDPDPSGQPGKYVVATNITDLAVEAGNGKINLSDYSSLPLKNTAIKFDLHHTSLFDGRVDNRLIVDTTSKTQTPNGPVSNPDYWTIKDYFVLNLNQEFDGIQMQSANEGYFTVQGLETHTEEPIFRFADQLVLDDTGRDSDSSLTLNLLSMPGGVRGLPAGPELSVNLGPGTDYLYVAQGQSNGLYGLRGDIVTINGYTDPIFGLSSDSLHIYDTTSDQSVWTIDGSFIHVTGDDEFTLVDQLIYYNRLAGIILQSQAFSTEVDLSPTAHNLDELPQDINLNSTGRYLTLNIYNQHDSNSEDWTVNSSEIKRERSDPGELFPPNREIFLPSGVTGFPGRIVTIDGGVGGSHFRVDPTTGINNDAGGNLAELDMNLTLNGQFGADSLMADDENDPVPGDQTWHVNGTYFDNSSIGASYFQIAYSDIPTLSILTSRSVHSTFILSSDLQNLDDLPANVDLNFGDVVLDDQNNKGHLDDSGMVEPTDWTVSQGGILERSIRLDSNTLKRTIKFIGGLTINAGSGNDNFIIDPTTAPGGGGFEIHPIVSAGSLAVDGGAGVNTFKLDDSANDGNPVYTLQNSTLGRRYAYEYVLTDGDGIPLKGRPFETDVYTDTISYMNLQRLEVDGGTGLNPFDFTNVNTFDVESTPAGMTAVLSAGGTTNKFNVPGNSAALQGPVELLGQGSQNTLERNLSVQGHTVLTPNSGLGSITTAADGTLWFAENRAGQLGSITASGVVSEFAVAISNDPTPNFDNLVFGPDGNLWFIDRNTGEIAVEVPGSNLATVVYSPPANGGVGNLAAAPSGLWFTEGDRNGSHIGHINTSTGVSQETVTLIPVRAGENAEQITLGPDGTNLWFLESSLGYDYVARITPSGTITDVPISDTKPFVGRASALTAGPNGKLWASMDISVGIKNHHQLLGSILQIDTTAFDQGQISANAFQINPLFGPRPAPESDFLRGDLPDGYAPSVPANLIAGPKGDLWFVDTARNAVGIVGPDGKISEWPVGDPFGGPVALTAGPDGNISFTDPATNQIGTVLVQGGRSEPWLITAQDQGTLYGNVNFSSMQNLAGGSNADTYAMIANGSLSGTITGGTGFETLDYTQYQGQAGIQLTGPGSLHGSQGTAANVSAGFDNIDLIANGTSSSIKFDDSSNTAPTTWTLASAEGGHATSGVLTSISLTRQVQGQTTITVALTGPTNLEIDGGSGGNSFDVFGIAQGMALTIHGGSGGDAFDLGDASHSLTDLQGPITFLPGSGVNSLSVDASGSEAENQKGVSDVQQTIDEAAGAVGVVASGAEMGNFEIQLAEATLFAGGFTVNHGGLVDTVNLEGLPVNTPFTDNGTGQGSLNVGGTNGLDGIQSDVTVNAPDSVTLDDRIEKVPAVFTVTDSGVTFRHPSSVTSGTTGLKVNLPHDLSLATTILAGGGSNIFNIESAEGGHATSLVTGGGDVVNIGNNGSVQGILDTVSILGVGATLVVDDSADPTPTSVTLTPTTITGLAPAVIAYSGISNLTIDGGSGGNQVTIQNTAAGTSTTVNSGYGIDFVYVRGTTGPLSVNTQGSTGSAFTGFEDVILGAGTASLSGIQGPLTVNTVGRPGLDYATMALYDTATTTPQTYTLTDNTILRSGAAPVYYYVTNQLEFHLGSGGNLVNIQSTFPGLPEVFVGGVSNDTFNVGDMSNTLNGIQSHLSFQIANPGSRVILHDDGNSGDINYTLAHDPAISPSNFVKRSNSGYYILYSGPLQTLQLLAGSGNNTFFVKTLPPSTTAVNLDGGGGTNTLDYSQYVGDITVNLPLGTATGLSGGIRNIESVNGSIGNDLIVGSAAAQVLAGGTGRNIIIAGASNAHLIGGRGDNILIGGSTDFDQNSVALNDFMTEWLRTDLNFDQRAADINTGGATVPGNKPPSALKGTGFMLNKKTVHDDHSANVLTGSSGSGTDWFFWDPADDTLQNKKKGDGFISIH
jgi:streptogramin lyase